MTYAKLVKTITLGSEISQDTADWVLKEFAAVTAREAKAGVDVVIPHFGRFTKKVHPAKPLFGGKVQAKERVSVRFVPFV